ncbi:MAG: hypothetical protein OHK0023_04810 [Anaerolineae bacterium]
MKNRARCAYATFALGALLLVAACGGNRPAGTPQPTATQTPTPISSPLPTVATEVPFGDQERPYRVIVMPSEESRGTGSELEAALREATGKAFEVFLVSNGAEALSALCSGEPAMGILDGWTLAAAAARGCAAPRLVIERRDGTGVRSSIIVARTSGIATFADFRSRDFCRIAEPTRYEEMIGWVMPALTLRANGFDPFRDFRNVRRVADLESLLREVAQDTCVGAIEAGSLARQRVQGIPSLPAVISELQNGVSLELPHGGFAISALIAPNTANEVTTLLRDSNRAWQGLVDAERLIPITEQITRNMSTLIGATDLGVLGR